MADLELGTRVRQAESSTGQGLGADYLVLDLSSGEYYDLSEVGGWFWERLDGSATVGELAAEVAGRYGVEPARAQADLLAFVGELVQSGLAEVVEHDAG